MTNLKKDPRQLSNGKDDMLRECQTFYSQLYQSRDVECNAYGMLFKNLPKITQEQIIECDKSIDTVELGGGAYYLGRKKVPLQDPVGLPSNSIKFFGQS